MSDKPAFTDHYIDLAQPRLGAEVISTSDEFFAPKEGLIKPEAPIFIPDKYNDHGKWMDGWESRRKREDGHDFCVIRLCPGIIHGVDVDTSFFTGNYPPEFSLEACHSHGDPDEHQWWFELLPHSPLAGDSHHYLKVSDRRVWTHLRLNIYPDGGIARLRVYGVAHCEWNLVPAGEWVDLAAMARGGRALSCNNMHYGHMSNLIAPGHSANMGDGWETRRRREPGNDWAILQLGHPGGIRRVVVDTAFFKGNYPASCSVHGAMLDEIPESEITADASFWHEILPPQKLGPDKAHVFEEDMLDPSVISHVRLDIYPDGGISRLRLFGSPHRD